MNKALMVALVAIMMIASPIAGEVITQDVEIRGEVANGDIDYNYANFAGFWYDLKNNVSSETMDIDVNGRTIVEGALVYQCTPKMVKYKSPELNRTLGKYKIVGFMAEKYIGYDNKTNKLVKLLIEWGGKKDVILTMADPLEFPEGYALYAQEIDLEGGKCLLALYKDGKILDLEVVEEGNAYKYFDDDDVLVFSAFVDTVFRGTDSNIVVVKFVFLRSEDIVDVRSGDNFGVMKVTSTSGGITLENDETINLDADSEIDIMNGLYFKVADHNDLRYYLAKRVSLVCPECPECPELKERLPCPDCPDPEPCPECPECPTPPPVADKPNDNSGNSDKTTPGFEAVFAIAGLFVVGYLVLKQRD